MARPWRDVISHQNWVDYVINRAGNSDAKTNRVSKLKAVFQHRSESPLAFLTYIGGKLQAYHAVAKDRKNTLDDRIKRLGELSSLAFEYLNTFKVDLEAAARRPEGEGKNQYTGVYNSGRASQHSVDRNVLSLARRSLRKAAYLKEMKKYYSRGGQGYALRSPNALLLQTSKAQYKWDDLIGLSPGVRMEQLDFVHRGDFETDDDASITCGAAFKEWMKAMQTGAEVPFFLWLENHPVCLEDDKQLLETRSVLYGRADQYLNGKRRDANDRNLLRLVSLTVTPTAYDLRTGEAIATAVSTKEYRASRPKDPRGDKTFGAGVAAFVWTETTELFIANHLEQEFHHSSFVSGRNVRCAGMIVFENGKVTAISNNSGHYKPRKEHVRNFVLYLKDRWLIDANAAVEVHMGAKRCWRGTPADFLSKFNNLENIANVAMG